MQRFLAQVNALPMPQKLFPEASAATLQELANFCQSNVASLAVRNGANVYSSLRHKNSKEERRFHRFLWKQQSRFTEVHRQQLARAFQYVVQARAAGAAPVAHSPARKTPATRRRLALQLDRRARLAGDRRRLRCSSCTSATPARAGCCLGQSARDTQGLDRCSGILPRAIVHAAGK